MKQDGIIAGKPLWAAFALALFALFTVQFSALAHSSSFQHDSTNDSADCVICAHIAGKDDLDTPTPLTAPHHPTSKDAHTVEAIESVFAGGNSSLVFVRAPPRQ